MALAWLCVVVALARPQRIEPPVTRTVPVRDLLLAVDLSASMQTKDFTDPGGKKVDRLSAVKQVLDDFLSRRKGDRVGLIFFGNAAFVQAPFTEDLGVCRELLSEAQVGMAGPKTAVGDAIGLAIHVFEEGKTSERVLIVLTDGNDTGSQVPPQEAARVARDRKIIVHTVAVGDPKAAGEEALDEQALKDVAKVTGGSYAFAADRAALQKVYDDLDRLQTREAQTVSHRPRVDLFAWPLALGLLLTMAYHALSLLKGAD
jgi:Ca-activated chloride channel family protein